MFEWMEELNAEQRAAVLHDDGHLLVVAGAGTGKTKTLACRVARLLSDGVQPERILLLTFSRRAAREMVSRAARMAETDEARRVWGGTFHSVANRLLRHHGAAVGLRPGFTVLDQGDCAELLGLVRHGLGLGEKGRRFPKKDTLAAIYSRVVNSQAVLSEVVEAAYPWCRADIEGIKQVFAGYAERKRASNVVDYDDLLLYWRAATRTERTGAQLRSAFDHILVDEFQDTNSLQADIVAAMTGPHVRVTAVGDDAQAIYGFRAGSPKHMLDFPDRHPGASVVTLDRNYRSTTPILAVANAVMAGATEGFAKELRSSRPGGVRPTLTMCADEAAQAGMVCDSVLEHRERGVALREQAVLFRTGHHSDALEVELARRDVPFVKFGGLKFLEAAHVKDLVALLRVLENPCDELAWHRVLGMIDGVGPATIRRCAADLGVAEGTALRRFLAGECELPPGARVEVEALRAAWRDCAPDMPPASQIERLVAPCRAIFGRRYPTTVAARLGDLEQLRLVAGGYRTRERFLAELTLDPPASTGDHAGPPHLDDDYLNLSTIHSAKGGEWRAVHVIHVSDGNIPSDMALGSRAELEEERRLLYVAITRARDSLTVSYPLRYYFRRTHLDDGHTYGQPSRFLSGVTELFDLLSVGADAIDEDPIDAELAALWR